MKPARWRPAARRDADDATAWYADQGGAALALAFIDALESAVVRSRRHPGAGSQRHASLVPGLPAPLRFTPLDRFDRYLVYYLAVPTHVEVIRVWDAARGLEPLLSRADPGPEVPDGVADE
jgi:toxin ParE1/3/4